MSNSKDKIRLLQLEINRLKREVERTERELKLKDFIINEQADLIAGLQIKLLELQEDLEIEDSSHLN